MLAHAGRDGDPRHSVAVHHAASPTFQRHAWCRSPVQMSAPACWAA